MSAACRVLVVGAGGLSSPAAKVLATAGVGHVTLVDDDVVDVSNLQRQTLYTDADIGTPKVRAAIQCLRRISETSQNSTTFVAREKRVLPDSVLALVDSYDLVIEGADNFATKFMIADACTISGVPSVQAGAVRWGGWAMGTVPGRTACLRCVFEDIPRGRPETCAGAGVLGPVVGVLGALQAAIAIQMLGQAPQAPDAAGRLWSYRGLAGSLRRVSVARNPECLLCAGKITTMDLARYTSPECAA